MQQGCSRGARVASPPFVVGLPSSCCRLSGAAPRVTPFRPPPQTRRTNASSAAQRQEFDVEPLHVAGAARSLCEAHQKRIVYAEQVGIALQRKRNLDTLKWAIRSAVSVWFVALLVMDGRFEAKAHGYGILVLITCINCSEQLQGDLFRKSMERFLGTSIGTLAAMLVLSMDDFLVPETRGWYAREDFYLTIIVAFTMAGVLTRSRNTMKPLYDYSFSLSVLSFDFLLLDSYKHADQFRDGVFSILMVTLGGIFTCAVGTLLLPQFAGAQLVSLTADTLEAAAAQLERTAAAFFGCHPLFAPRRSNRPSADRCLQEIQMMEQLVSLAVFEVRLFPPPADGGRARLAHFSASMDWTVCIRTAEAAAAVCEVCECVQSICEAEGALWGTGDGLSFYPCPAQSLAVGAILEAVVLVQFCAASLRPSQQGSMQRGYGSEGRKQFREALHARHTAFLGRLAELHRDVESSSSSNSGSMKSTAVRALSVQLPPRVHELVAAVSTLSDEGILEPPIVGCENMH
eukprot:CAMPEP_0117685846 /NCGR_PEP_ID=MMETSP0804-20121206/22025_1 /TAXON_ID=1074897 /ORGANISM="Tetraselmis astigmatica, Strain CCMP880" /LENGTH=515 /DNA_ID=CAMNT_0005497281 /DNA_START=276 /DNA_END=1823 /DNA_ORIENTATION=-